MTNVGVIKGSISLFVDEEIGADADDIEDVATVISDAISYGLTNGALSTRDNTAAFLSALEIQLNTSFAYLISGFGSFGLSWIQVDTGDIQIRVHRYVKAPTVVPFTSIAYHKFMPGFGGH